MALRAVDFTTVTIDDTFWKPWQSTNQEVTIAAQYKWLQQTGRTAAIDPAYGDENERHIFWDSDVAKWIEAASYSLAAHPNQQMEEQIDAVVDKFAKLQRPDGYINSWYTAVEPKKRWSNLRDNHELYCAGHLIEAAVAYCQATGKRKLLDMVIKYADLICEVFGEGPGQLRGYPGHQELELALVKLYQITNEHKYLDLAAFFINERGQEPHYFTTEAKTRGEDPADFGSYARFQAHVPVREQRDAVGHAVRAMYMYSGMIDVANETGDLSLVKACEILWESVVQRKMYITGGVGQVHHYEAFADDYFLPEESAYCETCAAIGMVFWNHRMLQLNGDGKYADVLERALYNGCLSGISLQGDTFFYVNPLLSKGGHHRQAWFSCSCCPGNISRLIGSVGQYIYSASDDAIWVNLYVQGTLKGEGVKITQQTNYPWDGHIEFFVDVAKPREFAINLRLPGWCRDAKLLVNGELVDVKQITKQGYAQLKRIWVNGDRISLSLPMPVERVRANPMVREAKGKVALQRGPLVYCLEELDNQVKPLSRIELPASAELTATFQDELLGGVMVISGQAMVQSCAGELYSREPVKRKAHQILAIPYYAWDNRKPGEMLVWIHEIVI